MQLYQALKAYQALTELMDQELDYKSAYTLVSLKQKMKPHIDFFLNEEMKLVQTYGRKNEEGMVEWDGNGQFQFQDADTAALYNAKHKELECLKVTPEIEPVIIKAPAKIRAAIIEAVDGLINFEEEC